MIENIEKMVALDDMNSKVEKCRKNRGCKMEGWCSSMAITLNLNTLSLISKFLCNFMD